MDRRATPLPDYAGRLFLAGCAVMCVALIAAGIMRVVREVLALKRRVERYAAAPFPEERALLQKRLASAERSIGSLPRLSARAGSAAADLDLARRGVARSGGEFAAELRSYVRR